MQTFERVQKETDNKFRRVMVIESQLAGVKLEVELLRLKKVKEETKGNGDSSTLLSRIVKSEKLIEKTRENLKKLGMVQE